MLELRGKPAIKDPVIRNRLVELEARLLASEYNGYRLLTMQARGEEPGLAGMVMKLYSTQLGYDLARSAMDVLGDRGALAPGETDTRWACSSTPTCGRSASSSPAAAANIQRNIIAERGLGMPRDPATKR